MADFNRALGLVIKHMLITFLSFFRFWQGSDPRKNASINPNYSVRGKLQTRRCKLNKEINKELRLRAGAENLYKVSKNELYSSEVTSSMTLEYSVVNQSEDDMNVWFSFELIYV